MATRGAKVVVHVDDPTKERTITIKPFGQQLAEASRSAGANDATASITGTGTQPPDADGDGDID